MPPRRRLIIGCLATLAIVHGVVRAGNRFAPPPPGVDAQRLLPRAEAEAHLDLGAALAALVPPTPAPEIPGPAPEGRDAERALRHYVKGKEASLQRLYLYAINELEQAHKLDPGSPPVLRTLARAYLAHKQPIRATDRYRRLLAVDPENGEALFYLGLEAANRRDDQTAVMYLGRLRAIGVERADDVGASLLTDFWLWRSLDRLGYDRAAIELSCHVLAERAAEPSWSRFGPQIASVGRQTSAIWQSVGDAHARLGDAEAALAAYETSSVHPNVNPVALLARRIYAALELGRAQVAQETLRDYLGEPDRRVSDQLVQLCAYVAESSDDLTILREAVLDLYEREPDRADLARASAALLPPEEGVELLRELLDRRPDDSAVLGQLLDWLVGQDVSSACRLVVGLVEDHPRDATSAVRHLVAAVPEPPRALEALEALPESPARDLTLARFLVDYGAVGEAFRVLDGAITRWPENEPLLLLRLELASAMGETSLYEDAEAALKLDTAWSWLVRATGRRQLGELEAAQEAANEARAREPESRVVLLELAQCELAAAAASDDAVVQGEYVERATEYAREAAEVDAQDDDPYALLVQIYGRTGVLADPDEFRDVARRLYANNPDSRLYARLTAEEAMGQARFDSARQRLLPLYEADRSDSATLAMLVSTWVRQERIDDAIAWIDGERAKRPGDPDLMRWRVRLLILREQVDEAIGFLTQRCEDEPRDYTARRLLESTYRQAGQLAEAIPLGEARLRFRPEGVRRRLELAALNTGADRVDEALVHVGWILEHAEEATLDQLATVLTLARRLAQDRPEAHRLTLELAEKTIDRFPEAPLQVYGIALVAMIAEGEPQERFDAMADRAAESAPGADRDDVNSVLMWRDMAQAMIDAGYPDAASLVMRARSRRELPLSETARAVLAIVSLAADAAADAPERSRELLNQLALGGPLPDIFGNGEPPTMADVLFELSTMYALLGRQDGAEALLREVVDLDPDNATALNNYAYGRVARGLDDAETVASLERAAQLTPDSAFVLDSLGWLRYKQARFEGGPGGGAIEMIRRAAESVDAPSAEVLDHLGDTRWRLGDSDGAVDAWRRAAEQLADPEHRERFTAGYLRIQTQQWGLLVLDPTEMYDRDFGAQLRQIEKKLAAVESGEEPPVAPTFDDHRAQP